MMLASVYVCRYMHMSPITKKSFQGQSKKKGTNSYFKHLNINPWISAHMSFGEFENLILIRILSITHLYSCQVQCARAF